MQAGLPSGATERGGSRDDAVTGQMTEGTEHTRLPDSGSGLSLTCRLSVKEQQYRFHRQ